MEKINPISVWNRILVISEPLRLSSIHGYRVVDSRNQKPRPPQVKHELTELMDHSTYHVNFIELTLRRYETSDWSISAVSLEGYTHPVQIGTLRRHHWYDNVGPVSANRRENTSGCYKQTNISQKLYINPLVLFPTFDRVILILNSWKAMIYDYSHSLSEDIRLD